ncbi:Vir-like protein [Cryptosporidium canis]|nr:Vir-like protein [Cryptosporidium canis]
MKKKEIKTRQKFEGGERFNSRSDPRFKPLFRKENKVKIDERFNRMFTDADFSVISAKDPFGKKTIKKDESLSFLYENSDGGDNVNNEFSNKDVLVQSDSSDSEGSFQWEGESDNSISDKEAEDEINNKFNNTSDSVWEDNPLNKMGLAEGGETNRLALIGLDWDNITADDIYVVLSSFLSSATIKAGQSNPSIKKISIYPSKFGKDRMDYEYTRGPLIGNEKSDNNKETTALELSNDITEEDYEAIRKYQVEKSLYYYAVVECDSIETAVKLYDELDGMEAEFCIDSLEIRFVPDDIVDFQFEPTSVSTSIPSKYKQPECFTSALRHSKPTLTWDDTPIERVKFLRKKFTPEELLKSDFDAYLGSSESENEFSMEGVDQASNENTPKSFSSGMRDILLGDAKEIFDNEINENGSESEMCSGFVSNNDINELFNTKCRDLSNVEIEFNPDLEDLSMELIAKGKKRWEDASYSDDKQKTITPWQAYLEKRKQKRKERKMQLRERIREQKLQRERGSVPIPTNVHSDNSPKISEEYVESSDEDRHFDMKKISLLEKSGENVKSKRRKALIMNATAESTQSDFLGSISDPRISKIFTDSDFAIDPTNPIYKNTEFNKKLLLEKRSQKMKRNSSVINKSKQSSKKNTMDEIGDDSFNLLPKKVKKC